MDDSAEGGLTQFWQLSTVIPLHVLRFQMYLTDFASKMNVRALEKQRKLTCDLWLHALPESNIIYFTINRIREIVIKILPNK